MTTALASAVFDTHAEAEQAVSDLRSAGVNDSAISVIAQQGDGTANVDGETAHHGTSGTAKGLTIGAGVGALFGLAALAIPGVGPFVAAGALAHTLGAAGGAVAAGAIVGGTAGGITGALTNAGIDAADASYYEERLGHGGTVVTVDSTTGIDAVTVHNILHRNGGHSSSMTRSTVAAI